MLAGCGGRSPSGSAIFARSCAGCHTLTGHDTRVRGGDLAIATLSTADVASFVRVMPVRLSGAEVAAVAAYVSARTGFERTPTRSISTSTVSPASR